MQKIINGIAILSGVVSLTVVGSGVFIYLQKDAIVENVKGQVMEAVTGSLGDALGGGALGGLTGSPSPGMDAAPSALPDMPTSPF
tara:strand:+ start:564 stop:818 length:255 start_codon:yes stop_codon:yes gene_type:complete